MITTPTRAAAAQEWAKRAAQTADAYDRLDDNKQEQEPPGGSSNGLIAAGVGTLLALQLSGFVMLRAYLTSAMCDSQVLMWSEILKLGVCLAAARKELHLILERWHRAIVPVLGYGVMNLLSFWSLKRLPANVSIVIIQLKTVWTAVFARFCLSRPLLTPRSFALVSLVMGCIAITADEREEEASKQFRDYLIKHSAKGVDPDGPGGTLFSEDAFVESTRGLSLLAVGALTLETMLSGLMSVYMQVCVAALLPYCLLLCLFCC